jgi:hypothetical protein
MCILNVFNLLFNFTIDTSYIHDNNHNERKNSVQLNKGVKTTCFNNEHIKIQKKKTKSEQRTVIGMKLYTSI